VKNRPEASAFANRISVPASRSRALLHALVNGDTFWQKPQEPSFSQPGMTFFS
jgi:hypothetical protein